MLLDNITLKYGDKVVARNINAELLPGELVCLIGRNGSGKSTLIKYLAKPKEGGKEAKSSKGSRGSKSSKDDIALVLTDRIDAEGMTVEDVVALGRAPYTGFFGIMSDRDWEIVKEAMEEIGVTELRKRFVNTLSDGERQKVMIAKALAQQTQYILLDEPTAFLDYPTKVETMKMLQRLCKEQGKAVLISTHDLDIALRFCDKVWEMGDPPQPSMDTSLGREKAGAVEDTCSTLRVITPEEARGKLIIES